MPSQFAGDRCVIAALVGASTLAPTMPAYAQSNVEIPEIVVNTEPGSGDVPPIKQKYQLPQTSASITAAQIEQSVNAVDTEDAVKYLPSLFVRKRNAGDNQAVLASRVWGLNSSARTLIYVDDILISALIGNNNTTASPKWGMVAPEQIKRIDFLYGPFAAMYPGNSMGGVLNITTRMPDKPEASIKSSESFQTFNLYNTKDTYRTDQVSATFGNRWNQLGLFVSANYQNSYSQPLALITSSGQPANTTGTIFQPSRTGGVANVQGAGGLLHTEMGNVTAKASLDITDWLQANYTIGLFSNDQKSGVQTYLRDAAGNPTFGGNSGPGNAGTSFASNTYNLNQLNVANAFSLKTDTRGPFDWEIAVSRYDYLQDIQRNPFTVAATGTAFSDTGKITRLDGTNWTNGDARGIWRPTGPDGAHEVSFGVHADQYVLSNPVYRTTNWNSGPDATGQYYSLSNGKTETLGLWAQDAWRFAPDFKLTTGGRWDSWRAYDGFNLTTTTDGTTGSITGTSSAAQPTLNAARFSPKASLSWEPDNQWQVTGSVGIANRFPTVTELYQVAVVGQNIFIPNPNLKPEQSLATELAIARKFSDGNVRLSLFQDNTSDMLVAQNTTLPGTTTIASVVTNVDKVRNRGVELAWQRDNVADTNLDLFGSVTYVDSDILSDPSFVGANGSSATGKRVPNVPMWRSTVGATYHANESWAITVAGRYQSKIYSTLDNSDTVGNVFQAFDPFFVVDARIVFKAGERGSLAFGIDNIGNAKYYLFHPFPQRTFVMQGRLVF